MDVLKYILLRQSFEINENIVPLMFMGSEVADEANVESKHSSTHGAGVA